MNNNWKTYKLEDALDALIDYRGKTPKKTKNGIPLVTAKIVKKGRIQEPNEFISEEDYEAWMRRGIPEVGDVVLTTEAPLGEVAQIKNANIALAQRIVTLRGKVGVLDNSYLKYYLFSNKGQRRLQVRQSGTTVFGIKQSELRKVEIDCPPLKEQKQIAAILSALDDKIELNLQMNKTLEDMAMALYKHWFVDFGPFQDGAFVDSELGKIPKGWEVKSIGEFSDILNSKRVPLSTMQRSSRKGQYPYYGASGIIDSIDDYKFDGEYVIISEDGENLRSRNTPIAFRAVGQFWVNNHAHILQGKQKGINELIICHFAQLDMSPYLTGAVQPKLNKQNLFLIKIPMPIENDIINETFKEFYNISRLLISNIKENQSLTKTRDSLLPKLISGEIRVKEAEVIIKEQVMN